MVFDGHYGKPMKFYGKIEGKPQCAGCDQLRSENMAMRKRLQEYGDCEYCPADDCDGCGQKGVV